MNAPIILFKYDESLCGYSVGAIHLPTESWNKTNKVVTVCLNELHFRILKFSDQDTKKEICKKALDFYSKNKDAHIIPSDVIVDLTDKESLEEVEVDDLVSESSFSSSDVSGTTNRGQTRFDYVKGAMVEHELSSKVKYYNYLEKLNSDDTSTKVMCGVRLKLAKRSSQEYIYVGM